MKVILLYHKMVYDENGICTHGYPETTEFNRIDEARNYFKNSLPKLSSARIIAERTGKEIELLKKRGEAS